MKAESRELVREAVAAGFSVIIDNTNLNVSTRNSWIGLAQELGMRIETHDMNATLTQSVWRDKARPGRLGRAVIETMALMTGNLHFHKGERLVIVDMDGTLADCSHRRHFTKKPNHDWDAFESYEQVMSDPPFPVIVEWVKKLWCDYTVLIVSGRQISRAGIATEDWLAKHEIHYDHLFMRNAPGPDYEIKQKILDKLPKDQIAFCIDDRDQVVDMWRKNGLTVYQVAEGNF
jgi:hypothetical protein